MTRSEFLQQAMAAAKAASAKSGFPAGITVAQAALESAWGQSWLSRDANNYFGIKAYGKRDWVAMPTHEVENGMVKSITAEFARFQSMARQQLRQVPVEHLREAFGRMQRHLLHQFFAAQESQTAESASGIDRQNQAAHLLSPQPASTS